MKNRGRMQWGDLACSFLEIWKFNRCLFLILLVNVIVKALQPFPGIILSGLIIDSIVRGEAFSIFLLYIGLMFGMNFFLMSVSTCLGKGKEYLFLEFSNKLNNDISKKCLAMDYEQFNDSYFQDSILLIAQMAQGN